MAYGFSSPGDALNPLKNSMHPFEMATYLFKGRNLGYSIISDKCASCTAPANVIDRIGRDNIPGRPGYAPWRGTVPGFQPDGEETRRSIRRPDYPVGKGTTDGAGLQ